MRARTLAIAGLVAACASPAREAEQRAALLPAPDRALSEGLLDARRVVAGKLVRVERALEYEPLGGLLGRLFGAPEPPRAYNATIHVDSTLLGDDQRVLYITFFAPPDARIPEPDTTAIWVLHRRPLWRLRRCSEIQSMTSAACPYDVGLALDSDGDVRPLADWPRLRGLLTQLGLRSR